MPDKVSFTITSRGDQSDVVAIGQQLHNILRLFDPVTKIFGSGIAGRNEWIYHIHNILHCKYNILSFYDNHFMIKIVLSPRMIGFSLVCAGTLLLLCAGMARLMVTMCR